jgi:hypothetical protein
MLIKRLKIKYDRWSEILLFKAIYTNPPEERGKLFLIARSMNYSPLKTNTCNLHLCLFYPERKPDGFGFLTRMVKEITLVF